MQKGKKLENEVKKYLKDGNLFFHKFQDSFSARAITTPVPSDFIIWPPMGPSILLECKETQKPLIPLTAFRPAQFRAIRESVKTESTQYYVIIHYNKSYYILHGSIILLLLEGGEKSIKLNNSIAPFNSIDKAMDFIITEWAL